MSHTNREETELKARLLQQTLKKHDPAKLKDLAFKLMQKHPKGSDEFKAFAALYEIMDIFNS